MSSIAGQLAQLLANVQRPGDFHVSGLAEMLTPSLEVRGVGRIALPLLPTQAQEVAAVAEQAPYGRGEQTLVDTEVRSTWQIDSDRVSIEGRGWSRTLDKIVELVSKGLGVDVPFAAEFYKLLLYEKGGFFRSHRDSEKASGMFGTLIVLLPSEYTGGAVAIRHEGREVMLDPRSTDPAEAAFVAFYADCLHEVLPVTEGWRLALVYNLIRSKGAKNPLPPNHAKEQDRLATLLRRWSEETKDSPQKLVYPLEHSYTAASLSFAGLKGADAAKAATLLAASRASDFDLHLAIVSIEESGAAEYTGRGWGRENDHDFEPIDDGDRCETLSGWIPAEESNVKPGVLPIEAGEVSPPGVFDNLVPDEESFHEATGNEGASFERSYRRAALVLWPKRRRLAVINQGGLTATLPYLASLIEQCEGSGKGRSGPVWAIAHELAGHMIAGWRVDSWRPAASSSDAATMLNLLRRLDDSERIDSFLEGVCGKGGFGKGETAAVAHALKPLPPHRSGELLHSIVASNAPLALQACAELVDQVASSNNGMLDLSPAASALVAALPGDPTQQDPSTPWRRTGKMESKTAVAVLNALVPIDGALAGAALDTMLRWYAVYDFDEVLVPAALELAHTQANGAIERLYTACRTHLERRIAEDLTPPRNWARASRLHCKCSLCAELGTFLADPLQETWTLRSLQQNRVHVEETIRRSGCDVDTATLRKGSPHTLVCTKNQATFARRAAQRTRDLKGLERLTWR